MPFPHHRPALRCLLGALAIVSLGAACTKRRTTDVSAQSQTALVASPRSAAAGTEQAESEQAAPDQGQPGPLTVAVVFDQLGSDTLERLTPLLDPAGALAQAMRRGAHFKRSTYPFLNTLTAPGHAAIFTGAAPRRSGIAGNEEWREDRGAVVVTVDSPGMEVIGRPKLTAGSSRLRARTVAESLSEQTGGAAKIVSLALKDRSALFPVGKAADACVWYDTSLAGFTSSTQCGATLPAWLVDHQRKHPLSELLQPWQPLYPERYAKELGPDDVPGEGGGWGRTFPYDPQRGGTPAAALRLHPALSEYLVALADAAVVAEGMGRDAVPDLLVVSISGTDYVGHTFGPHSWEYADHLIRADRALGLWLSALEKRVHLSVMITSDHGVAPLPELVKARGEAAGRLFSSELQAKLEQTLDQKFGALDWVEAMIGSFIHFSREAKGRADFAEVLKLAKTLLESTPGVASVDVLHGAAPATDAELLASLPETGAPELYLRTQRHWIFGYGAPPGSGTNHGSGQDYDQQVPLLFYGAGVKPGVHQEPVNQLRAAPTLAGLVGAKLPDPATLPPLPLGD